jgi:ABC-type antimicrobial peptide transport system permease subunit
VEHLKAMGDITAVTAVYRDFLVQIVGRQTVTHVEVRAVDPAHFPLAGLPVLTTPGIPSLRAALSGPAVVLTADLAQALSVGKGAYVTITFAANGASPRTATVTVGAIIANTGLFQQPELIMAFTYAAQLQRAIPQAHIENNATIAAQMATVLDSAMLLLGAVAGLTVLAALIIMANTVALALLEQRGELGILKAVGYTSRRVLTMTLIEQGLLGCIAAILALLPITLVASLLSQLGGFVLPLSLPVVSGLVGSSVLLCLLVATSVAWRTTQECPLEVLRYE